MHVLTFTKIHNPQAPLTMKGSTRHHTIATSPRLQDKTPMVKSDLDSDTAKGGRGEGEALVEDEETATAPNPWAGEDKRHH